MIKGKIKNYFPGGNTYLGFYSFYDNVLKRIEHLIIIKGGPGTGKSTLMKRIGEAAVERGYDIEYLWCSSDSQSLDGVVIPKLNTAVVDGTAPHTRDPEFPGAVDKIVNVGDFWDERKLKQHKESIVKLTTKYKGMYKTAYTHLRRAMVFYKLLEEYYWQNMDFGRVDKLTEELIVKIFKGRVAQGNGKTRHMFASAITPSGIVSYVDNLTEDMDIRYILTGGPGTGKSTLLKRVGDTAVERGFSVDYYHCALDPESLDMVVISEIKTALLDGRRPHSVKFKDSDEIIDLLKFVELSMIEANKKGIDAARTGYKFEFEMALKTLKDIKKTHDDIEEFYKNAMDFKGIDELTQKIIKEILS